MADSLPALDSGDNTSATHEASAGMPRWVKVSPVVLLALAALLVFAQVAGIGGDHGPGRHRGDGGHRAPADHR